MAYPTIHALLAKQNLFYDACNNFADEFLEEMEAYPVRDLSDEETLEESVIEWIGMTIYDMMNADVEDLINSYGILRALTEFKESNGEDYMKDMEPERLMFAILHEVMGQPVLGRVKGLLQNKQSEK